MSTIAQSVKNEHYVPRRYLDHFANEKRFFVFDPEIEKIMKEVDEQHIEKWFGENVETWLFDPKAKQPQT